MGPASVSLTLNVPADNSCHSSPDPVAAMDHHRRRVSGHRPGCTKNVCHVVVGWGCVGVGVGWRGAGVGVYGCTGCSHPCGLTLHVVPFTEMQNASVWSVEMP